MAHNGQVLPILRNLLTKSSKFIQMQNTYSNVQPLRSSRNIGNTLVRRCYSWWYGHKFEKGYKYQKIKHTNLDLLERHHYLMIDWGWEKDGDVEAGFMYAWCWYRRPNNA